MTLLLPLGGSGMNVTKAPFGVLAMPLGEVRTYNHQMDVILIRSHPRAAADMLLAGVEEKDETLTTKCFLQPSTRPLPYVQRLSSTQIMMPTTTEVIKERCATTIRTTILNKGSYILTPGPGCVISGSSGWTFQAGSTAMMTDRLADQFVLPALNASFHIDTDIDANVTETPLNWTHLETLARYSGHLPHLDRLSRLMFLFLIIIVLIVTNVCIL